MKVLVLSLLRLGDIILHREVAKSLKLRYPNCEVHFLIHSEFKNAIGLLPEVDLFHQMPRQEIQTVLVERAQSALLAFDKLQNLVMDLNSQNFDIVLNATHNNLSVRLMDVLEAVEKRGVALKKGRKLPDSNKWQTYLNENFSELQGSRFHYLEVLLKSLGLPVLAPSAVTQKSVAKQILLQVLTSDSKKNWGLARFRTLKKELNQKFPEFPVAVLCSGNEKEKVSAFFAENEILTPNLKEAAELLRKSRLLISGDTSISHLATQNDCQVLSLFLGSADPVKTAPWQTETYILQGNVACAPCSHSSACFQTSHLCAESISIPQVIALTEKILAVKQPSLPVKNLSDNLWRNEMQKNQFRTVPDFKSSLFQIEQLVWSAYLDSESVEVQSWNFVHNEILAIQKEHFKFTSVLQELKSGQANFEAIENQFPQWKDSLLRLKRNPTLASAWAETDQLCLLRQSALNQILNLKGVDNVREFRKPIESRFTEA